VVGAEDRVEKQDQEGYGSFGKMFQGSVRDTIWVRSLANLKTLDDFLNFLFFFLFFLVSATYRVEAWLTQQFSSIRGGFGLFPAI
jgi:hypothetical protein